MIVKQGISFQLQLYLSVFVIVALSFTAVASFQVQTIRQQEVEQLRVAVDSQANIVTTLFADNVETMVIERLVVAQLTTQAQAYVHSVQVTLDDEQIFYIQADQEYSPRSWQNFLFAANQYQNIQQLQTSLGNISIHVVGEQDAVVAAMASYLTAVIQLFAIVLVVSLLVLTIMGQTFLSPLQAVIQMANSVVGKRFQRLEFKTITKEFGLLQRALNSMIDAVSRTISEQSQFAEQLQQSLFIDPLTQLRNRKAFDAAFIHLQEEYKGHWLLLVRMEGLNAVNQNMGHSEGDHLLSDVALLLQQHFELQQLYRISGSEFAVSLEQADKLLDEPMTLLAEQLNQLGSACDATFVFAAVRCEQGAQSHNIMMALDARLTERRVNPEVPLLIEGRMPLYESYRSWKEVIDELIESQSISLDIQYAAELSDQGMTYAEFFARFNLPQQVDVAALFSLADRYDLAMQLDQAVITKALTSELTIGTTCAINISRRSLLSDDFITWLTQLKGRLQQRKLVFELSEYDVVQNSERARDFVDQVVELGAQVCIDRFGSSMQSLRYWQNLNINYVKIDAGFLEEIIKHDGEAVLMRYIVSMAHSAGMLVLVSQVADQSLISRCRELSVDMVQGRAVVPPAPYIA